MEPTHFQVVQYCESKGKDHTNTEAYLTAIEELMKEREAVVPLNKLKHATTSENSYLNI